MADEIHVDDVGTTYIATIADSGLTVDVSSATVKKFKFLLPSHDVVVKDAAFVTDGSDGQLRYVAEDDFHAEAGLWRWQPYLELADWQGHGDVQTFRVYKNLE